MPRPMGPHGRKNEKSKDFIGSMKRLFKSLESWRILLVIALILACLSAIFSIISPNILSDFSDTITEGIKPDTKKLEKISKLVGENIAKINYQEKSIFIMNSNISVEKKMEYQKFITSLSTTSDSTYIKNQLLNLPNEVLILLIDDLFFEQKKISSKDQVEFLKMVSGVNSKKSTEELLSMMDHLPKSIYQLVKPSIDMKRIKAIAFFLGTLYLLSALFGYIQSFSMATVSNNFAKKLRSSISNKINKLPLKYFDHHETGDILSIVTNDVDMIGMNMNQSLATLVTSITLFLGSILMMFITEWRMAITAILASLIGFMLMGVILSKSQKYFNKRQEELGNLNGYIEEIYSGHNVVKTYNGDKKAMEEFNELNNHLYDCNRKSQFLSGIMQPIMGFVGNLGYVAVCVVGALLTMNNTITFGVIVAFMIYVRLFTNPLSQIAQAMTSLQSTAAAAERVFEFLDEEEMSSQKLIKKHLDKNRVKGNIEFKNVQFGYNEDRIIINNFSAKVKQGQKIAIVGPTGAGKTTMVNLLMKFYEINKGDILIDGVSIQDLTRENIHDLFVMVLQDTWLFSGSIEDNIRFNKENISEEEVWNSLKTVGVSHFVKTLPGGIHANVEDDDTISQGQKQLLTIARGMIEDAPFLILDEATSNVDTRTEELVQKAMDKLTEGKTSFIIAHRLSTIKNADLILVMKDGNIIEQGNHDELMKKKGFYEGLYNSQFEL